MAIRDWSTVAADNGPIADGFPENMAAGLVNDRARELMASVRVWYEDAQWINLGHTITRISDTQFSADGADYTAIYHTGRMVKMIGGSTAYGEITGVTFGVDTIVTVNVIVGSIVPTGLTDVSVGAITRINPSIKSASEGSQGLAQKATDAEVTTGTENTKFCTPAGIAQAYTPTNGLISEIQTFGSFNITFTGFSTPPSATAISYAQIGNLVTLSVQSGAFGTSNATTMTSNAGEVPAALRPTSSSVFMLANVRDSGTDQVGVMEITTAGTINFFATPGSGAFTASGSKGISQNHVSYILNG